MPFKEIDEMIAKIRNTALESSSANGEEGMDGVNTPLLIGGESCRDMGGGCHTES